MAESERPRSRTVRCASSRWYARSDLADRYYAAHIFGATRFADLPRERPLLLLNATDIGIGIGARFAFLQDHFDRLCSDLDGVRISRAVAASAAFPVAFTPLGFANYPAERCGYSTPSWVENARADLELNASRFERALDWSAYESREIRFIHLNDGGLVDNLGLRGPMLGLQSPSSPLPILRLINQERIRRVAIVVVDARTRDFPDADRSAHAPGILSVLHAAATEPMANTSTDSIELARQYISAWNRQLADAGDAPPVAFYLVRVSFAAERDAALRAELEEIGTRLQLPPAQLTRVVEAGARLLRQSPGFACLLHALAEDPPALPTHARCPE